MRNTSDAVQAVDNAVNNIVKSRRTLSSYRNMLEAVRGDLVKVIKLLCPKIINADWSSNEYSIYYRVDAEFCKPTVMFYLGNLDSFKDERLTKMLSTLDDMDSDRSDSTDYAQSLNRVYRFNFGCYAVRVDATVKSDSPTCRAVVIDTKIVKQDVYAIKCD
jgi:hypothetical protein